MGIPIQLIDIEVPFAWEAGVLLDTDECSALLASTEGKPWLPGTVNGREGRTVQPDRRDVDVCFWRDPALGSELTARLRHTLPGTMRGAQLLGIRSSIRVYRYAVGQFFGLHRDQKYYEDGAVSHLALLAYLDATEEGGDTFFPEVPLRVRPRVGHAVLFQNATLHAGEPVVRGYKHVLRADVMYRDDEPR